MAIVGVVLKPFWYYYGGKWRAAPRYPAPRLPTIIEPFAGAAGYSMRYPDRQIVLVEKYPTICEMWRYLIRVSPSEILRIPEVEDVEATWFVDPPYNNKAGSYYVHSKIDHAAIGSWCLGRKGQVLVCENEGASWLPFVPFATLKAGVNGSGSREVLWNRDTMPPCLSSPPRA